MPPYPRGSFQKMKNDHSVDPTLAANNKRLRPFVLIFFGSLFVFANHSETRSQDYLVAGF